MHVLRAAALRARGRQGRRAAPRRGLLRPARGEDARPGAVPELSEPMPELRGERVRSRRWRPGTPNAARHAAEPRWRTGGGRRRKTSRSRRAHGHPPRDLVEDELAGMIQFSEENEPDYRHAEVDIFLTSGIARPRAWHRRDGHVLRPPDGGPRPPSAWSCRWTPRTCRRCGATRAPGSAAWGSRATADATTARAVGATSTSWSWCGRRP